MNRSFNEADFSGFIGSIELDDNTVKFYDQRPTSGSLYVPEEASLEDCIKHNLFSDQEVQLLRSGKGLFWY